MAGSGPGAGNIQDEPRAPCCAGRSEGLEQQNIPTMTETPLKVTYESIKRVPNGLNGNNLSKKLASD